MESMKVGGKECQKYKEKKELREGGGKERQKRREGGSEGQQSRLRNNYTSGCTLRLE